MNLKTIIHDWHVGHVLIGLGITLAFWVAGLPYIGAAVACGFYFGREVRDTENHLKLDFDDMESMGAWDMLIYAMGGWNLRNWSRDNFLDFLPVVATSIPVAYLLSMVKLFQ